MNNKKDIISIETSSNVCGISFISNGKCIKTIEEDSELYTKSNINVKKHF